MNRDEIAAFARGARDVFAGAALLYALGSWLGWWATIAIVLSGLGAAAWDAWRRPWWRLW